AIHGVPVLGRLAETVELVKAQRVDEVVIAIPSAPGKEMRLIVDTVKRAEDSNAIIVRVYEAYGQRGPVRISFHKTPKQVAECDLMEENDVAASSHGNDVTFYVKPFEIRTFKVFF
ncbi:MAG TPA: glycosyl hydrolase-related protein, partial [Candidatus Hydrogenedentes bacterium]|nr:glycosyl hydrolase-related protein [Candidatus Hydrogenedentota bacterium]